ncbi:MAG: hypothetical protein R2827_09555 [Bdellovibrionales bacterium]
MGKLIQKLLGTLVLISIFTACNVKTVRDVGEEKPEVTSDIQEYSIKEDRSQLEELREQIPEPVKKENDDLAAMLKYFNDGTNRTPSEIRSKFEKKVRRVRDKFRKDIQKERSQFTSAERKKRDKFLAELKSERDSFTAQPKGREERKYFFDEQATQRKTFFEDERDRRKDFESRMREKSDEFNSYVKETRREFYDLYSAYNKTYYERKNMERKQKEIDRNQRLKKMQNSFNSPQESGPSNNVLDEFDQMDQMPGQKLSPSGN